MARDGNRFNWRIAFLAGLLILATAGIVYRLFTIQVLDHERYRLEAQEEHLDKRLVRSARGAILDRSGFPLATTVDVFDLYVDRRAWRAAAAAAVAEAVAARVGRPAEPLLARLLDDAAGPVELIEDAIPFEVGREIEALGLPGVVLAGGSQRYYPEGDVASGLLGFIGQDHSGLSGLEADLEETLGGRPGALYFERDGGGRPIVLGETRFEPGTAGADVRLTIDRHVQRLVESELDFQIEAHDASGGTIIVMDPQTGAILAMASRPGFQPLDPLAGWTPDVDLYPQPRRHRCLRTRLRPQDDHDGHGDRPRPRQPRIRLTTTAGSGGEGRLHLRELGLQRSTASTTMTELMQKSLNTGAIWLSDLIGAGPTFTRRSSVLASAKPTHSGLDGEAAGILRT